MGELQTLSIRSILFIVIPFHNFRNGKPNRVSDISANNNLSWPPNRTPNRIPNGTNNTETTRMPERI